MSDTIIRDTSYGRVRGIQLEGRQVYKGIRYATAERFQKPVPYVHGDDGVYDATHFGYTCPQPGQKEGAFYWREFWQHREYATEHREDCLYLNIWTPDDARDLPVAIWIHGGAFMNGFSSKVEIDGEHWNKAGVILVSINYRVGPLGFLTCSLLDEAYGQSGNLGIYDQLCAIQWVSEHIASFGGDPDRITVMGQSSGAMSVQTLLSSPLLPKCVKGAVLQSGGGIENWMNESIPAEEMRSWHEGFLKEEGLDTLEKLLSVDASLLSDRGAAYTAAHMGMKLMFFPHMSEEILPGTYEAVTREGRTANVPCMIGCTKNDMTVGDDVKQSPLFTGCLKWASARREAGQAPDYVYVFTREPLGGEGQGAFHSADLWYSFHTLARSWREKAAEDFAVADEMCARWTAFIRTGSPNVPGLPDWRPSDGLDNDTLMVIGAD